MIEMSARSRFEAIASNGAASPGELARAARGGDVSAARDLAALFARAGFIDPGAIASIYDAAAAGWIDQVATPEDASQAGVLEAPAELWKDFWDFLEDDTPTDAGGFTMRTAALGGRLDAGFETRAIAASLQFNGVREAAAQGWPERFRIEDLARCPEGSLGWEFHELIVKNGFDLEVLDRDALGLARLTPPLDYLNVRILQCHDLWHIIGGYRTTSLHEVAISGFQLGQFGHNYSAQFLAVVTAKASLVRPEGIPLLFDVILTAWRHARNTPQLLGADWPSLWDLSADAVRQRLGVTPYASPFPADLFEQLQAQAA